MRQAQKAQMHPYKEIIIEALRKHIGDDYQRALFEFRNYSHDDMEKQHGQSGKSRRQVLEQYKAHTEKCTAAIAWADTL